MNTASTRTLHVIEQIVKLVPVGTNLALLQLIWTIISGAFLPARGAVHSALSLSGYQRHEIQRSWTALRYGVWHIGELLERYRTIVKQESDWVANEYEGYRPIAVDLTAIWRPRLQGWAGKLYQQLIGKACVGIGFGLIAEVGRIDGHRLPILKAIVRGHHAGASEDDLKKRTLRQAVRLLGEKDVLLHDGGVTLTQLHQAGVPRYVTRLSTNCTGRRNKLPPYKGRGAHPKKGVLVRPLERVFKGKVLAATAADARVSFKLNGRTIVAQGWLNLMRADLRVADKHELFSIWVIDDPYYDGVLVLGTNLPETVSPTALYQLYIDRWPVEQIPLVAKQLLGCHRQFVFAHTSCWRLGELAFFVGNLLSWLAATSPPIPSGYWDRHPKKQPVASNVIWHALFFQKNTCLSSEFEKRGLLPLTCRKELQPTAALNVANHAFSFAFGPYC